MKLIAGIFAHPPIGKITHSPRKHFFENIFSPKVKRAIENYHLLYQNSIWKYENDLEH